MKRLALAVLFLFSITTISFAQTKDEGLKALEFAKYESAKKVFHALITKEPQNADAYYYMGNVYFASEMLDSAEFYYNKAIQINANAPLALVGKGKMLLQAKKYEEAKKQFEAAVINSGGKDHFVMQQIAAAYAETQTTSGAEYGLKLIEKANELTKNNDLYYRSTYADVLRLTGQSGKGATEYENILYTNDKFALAALRLGQLYTKVENYDRGMEYYNKVIAIDPNYAPVYRDLGEFHLKRGQVNKAIENYEKFLSMIGNSPSERLRYASLLFLNKKYPEALTELKKVKADTNNYLLLRLMGYTSFQTENYDEALRYMTRYFDVAKESYLIIHDYEYYGKILNKRGMDSLAIIAFEKGLKMDSTNLELYDGMADSYSKMKKYGLAAQTIQRKLNASGERINAQDYFTMGRHYYYAEMYPEADSAFVKVTKYFPNYPIGFLYRARINAAMDPESDKELAKPYFEQFLEQTKAEPEKYKRDIIEAYSYLGYLAYKKNDNTKTREYFSKILELDPSHEGAKEIMTYLNQK